MFPSLAKYPDRIDLAHPLLQQQYAVFTPPIEELVSNIANWIDQQTTGAYIYGPSRYGKSTGVENFLRAMLFERFGREMPLLIWTRPSFGVGPTESRFWREILGAMGHLLSEVRKQADQYREQVISSLVSETVRTRIKYVVLVIDEAQSITDAELKWLLTLQNELVSRHSIRMSVFQIGSHQMGYVFSSLAMTDNRHLAARFYVADAPFHGLRSVDEVKYALQGYDEDSEWPDGSGFSYTAYFAADAYTGGFRLANSSAALWEAMVSLLPVTISKVRQFPMKYIALSAEQVLKDIARGADANDATSLDSWINRLKHLEFSKYMRIVVDTHPASKTA